MQGILISHTHWDRAWYLPFEGYRLHLVALIDRVLDVLGQDPGFASFTLDGQTVVLEDYREIRPERWPEVVAQVKSGRLQVGPCFVLPDEFLVSGEALIRNLQRGIRLVKELGGQCRDGYMPDSFGHIAQMPQILQGFGLRSFLFMRGVSADLFARAGCEFWWEAPDGSRVLALYLRGGYDVCSALGYPARFGDFRGQKPEISLAADWLQQCVQMLAPDTSTGVLILCNGGDHMPPQPEVISLIAEAQKRIPEVDFSHGSYADAVDSILAKDPELVIYRGELLENLHHPILSNVWSSRSYLKVANQQVQSLLEKIAEPLVAALGADGIRYVAHISEAWRHLLLCHPHDDICGCGVDPIHQDNLFHYRQAQIAAEAIIADCWRALALRHGISREVGSEWIGVFNPHPRQQKVRIEVELLWASDMELSQDVSFELTDPEAKIIPVWTKVSEARVFEARYLNYRWGQRVRVAFWADLPALGFAFYKLAKGTRSIDWPQRLSGDLKIENQMYLIKLDSDNSIRILHKQSGRAFERAILFEDQKDEGDLYSFSPDPNAEASWSSGLKPMAQRWQDPGRSHLQLSYFWDDQLQVEIEIILEEESEQIEYVCTVHNHKQDHRLRVLLPLVQGVDCVQASVPFGRQERHKQNPVQPEDLPERYQGYPGELVYSTQFSQDCICAQATDYKISIAHRGLHEFEIIDHYDQTYCALTLIRSVGILSREGGRIRRVQAGPSIQTPEGQCEGTHLFRFAWQMMDPALSWAEVAAWADFFVHPVRAEQVWIEGRSEEILSEAMGSFLEIGEPCVALSAFKRVDDGRVIVRLYNRSDAWVESSIFLRDRHWPEMIYASRCDLNEVELERIPLRDKSVKISFAPFQIQTLAFSFS